MRLKIALLNHSSRKSSPNNSIGVGELGTVAIYLVSGKEGSRKGEGRGGKRKEERDLGRERNERGERGERERESIPLRVQ
jgi:hypothetical protein